MWFLAGIGCAAVSCAPCWFAYVWREQLRIRPSLAEGCFDLSDSAVNWGYYKVTRMLQGYKDTTMLLHGYKDTTKLQGYYKVTRILQGYYTVTRILQGYRVVCGPGRSRQQSSGRWNRRMTQHRTTKHTVPHRMDSPMWTRS